MIEDGDDDRGLDPVEEREARESREGPDTRALKSDEPPVLDPGGDEQPAELAAERVVEFRHLACHPLPVLQLGYRSNTPMAREVQRASAAASPPGDRRGDISEDLEGELA